MAALSLLLLAAACGDDEPAARDSSSSSSSSSGGCAGPTSDPGGWGDDAVEGLPALEGMQVTSGDATQGVEHVYFTVPVSFTDAVDFYLQELPDHGFEVGTGDSEESEADIPFTGPDGQQLSLKLRGVPDPCETRGLLSIAVDGPADLETD